MPKERKRKRKETKTPQHFICPVPGDQKAESVNFSHVDKIDKFQWKIVKSLS